MNPFYFILLLSFLWQSISFAATLPKIIIQADKNPGDQHLTAIAIQVKNTDLAASVKLPDQLLQFPTNTPLTECTALTHSLYCGIHQSSCIAGNYLAPQASCLIWIGPMLPETTTFPTERTIQITALPNSPWKMFINVNYKIVSYVAESNEGKNNLEPDASFWHPIVLGGEADVRTAALWNSDLYIGGFFTIPTHDYPIHNIARWNGNAWSALGNNEHNGVNKTVYTLAAWNNQLYVGGAFDKVNEQNISHIATWDGETWSSLENGIQGNGGTYVFSLLPTQNGLYVGGMFNKAGTVSTNNVALWNGNTWVNLNKGTNGTIYSLALFNNAIYAGGEFTQADDKPAQGIAYWKQEQWNAITPPLDGPVYALTATDDNLYAGGDFMHAGDQTTSHIASWNGSQWSPLTTGVNNSIFSLVFWNKNLFVGGGFNQAGDQHSDDMAMWNGMRWYAAQNSGINAFVFAQVIVPEIKLNNG